VNVIDQLDAALQFIETRSTLRPKVGLVLGSGLGAFARSVEDVVSIPYGEIPHFPGGAQVVGHKGELVLGTHGGTPVAVMAGRAHYYEGYSLADVVFPVRVLARLGVEALILTNAAGAINPAYRPGELMVIEDHINLLGINPLIGPNEPTLGERFFDMTEAYDKRLRGVAEQACQAAGIVVHRGVYVAMTGPSYETPAEIRMARGMGADAVGMSTVPEVIAARHMGVRVVALSCLTNMAAGVGGEKLDHAEVLATGERVQSALIEVLGRIVHEVASRS